MTRNIIDAIKEQYPMDQVTPTEKAQIVVLFTYGPQHIARYSTTQKAEKAYKALKVAWAKWEKDGSVNHFNMDGDMFASTIDLANVLTISYVDHAKRAKFIPIPA